MNIVYSFCFYYGYFKSNNIKRHLEIFNLLKTIYIKFNFTLIINIMIDEHESILRQHIVDNMKHNLELPDDIIITHNYNSGGTIQGLDDTYTYLINNNYSNCYIAYFEEDFYPYNTDFLNDSINKLTDEYIYIGEVTNTEIANRVTNNGYKLSYNRSNAIKKASHIFNTELEIWTDGGYYFSTLDRLKKIKEVLGPFHCGNKLTKYNHAIDGIDYGEVGFPTRLYHNNFKFMGLTREIYFKHV